MSGQLSLDIPNYFEIQDLLTLGGSAQGEPQAFSVQLTDSSPPGSTPPGLRRQQPQ